jgi:uncharacterized protein
MSKHLFYLFLTLLLSLLGTIANAASFDCKLAHKGVETMICADEAVSKLDEQLDAVYTQVRKASNNESQEKAAQLAWLKTRNACVDLACLRRAYESRIAVLQIRVPAASSSGVVRNAENPHVTQKRNNAIKAVLEKLDDANDTPYDIGWFDLDGDGRQEAIVLMKGSSWCGSGGCTLAVLKEDAGSWKVVSTIPTCRSPVIVLDEKTNGWRDLAVVTYGGGDSNVKMTVLKFQRKTYVKRHEIALQHGQQTIIP